MSHSSSYSGKLTLKTKYSLQLFLRPSTYYILLLDLVVTKQPNTPKNASTLFFGVGWVRKSGLVVSHFFCAS